LASIFDPNRFSVSLILKGSNIYEINVKKTLEVAQHQISHMGNKNSVAEAAPKSRWQTAAILRRVKSIRQPRVVRFCKKMVCKCTMGPGNRP